MLRTQRYPGLSQRERLTRGVALAYPPSGEAGAADDADSVSVGGRTAPPVSGGELRRGAFLTNLGSSDLVPGLLAPGHASLPLPDGLHVRAALFAHDVSLPGCAERGPRRGVMAAAAPRST